MNVIVIGGSGFLGSHVADELTNAGHRVKIFDRIPSKWINRDQEMAIGDLLSESSLFDAMKGCDVVYNFAGISDLNACLDKPLETVKLNVLGTILALEISRKLNVKRFMYASSLYVYSRQGGFYRCSKQSAEHYIEEFKKVYDLDYTIMRYGSIYGPRSDASNGLYRIVKDAFDTGKVSYKGSAESMREYIHVVDAARASVKALDEDFKNQSVVLTGQQSIKVKDLLLMISEILGSKEGVDFIEGDYEGHYTRTPYAYQPKLGRVYNLPTHIDLGEGLVELMEAIRIARAQEEVAHETCANK
jgi:UDP-glucose 4-epimerase